MNYGRDWRHALFRDTVSEGGYGVRANELVFFDSNAFLGAAQKGTWKPAAPERYEKTARAPASAS
jgi:hypothetical protein